MRAKGLCPFSIPEHLIFTKIKCSQYTTEKNNPGAVLIRAVEPLNKIEELKQKRNTDKISNLCSGPGKLCMALGIDKIFNGTKLGKEVKVFDDGYQIKKINSSSRIGIKEALHLQWRFYL